MKINAEDIIRVLSRAKRPKSGREIASILTSTTRQKQEIYRVLHNLVRQGQVKQMRGGKFVLPKQNKPLQGVIRLLRNGSGIVSVDGGQREIKVPERALYGAMQGDLVEVVMGRSCGNRPEGRVSQILKREQLEFVGLYQNNQGEGYVLPIDAGTTVAAKVTGNLPSGLKNDQIVVLRLSEESKQVRGLSGHIIEILGAADDPHVEMLVIARRFGISAQFPEDVLATARQVSQSVTAEECHARRDLRHLPFVTIDGETAKDFDDAVTLLLEPSGGYRLFVAIADVAHYVQENSPLDREALLRGTSVYLPGTCIPMLPESLSNGICSLNPHVDRLVMVAELLFDRHACVVESSFCNAVICSRSRLTYTAVQQFLDQATQSRSTEPHLCQLPQMQELAAKLTQQRLRRGALDLDIPEAEILLDTHGRPESIVRAKRTVAHRLIEEFMLSANEAVASSLTSDGFPLLYRVHEPPVEQDLSTFFNLAKRLSTIRTPSKVTLIDRLQNILSSANGESEKGILNRLLLRSLKQAVYHPENRGHFGLAAECYCHFTSPIRRYPDLLVHRMLKKKLAGADGEALKHQTQKKLIAIGEQTSKTERRAIDAERDASAMKTCQYMLKHVGEIHAGHVTSVHPFGFFVELDAVLVEGLVHVASLGDTYYRFDDETNQLIGEGTNTIYTIGTPVTVTVRSVNVQRREIDFTVKQEPGRVKTPPFKKIRKRIK